MSVSTTKLTSLQRYGEGLLTYNLFRVAFLFSCPLSSSRDIIGQLTRQYIFFDHHFTISVTDNKSL